ncbi:MAG: DUF6498-containing protein [bacterium]
MTTTPQKQNIVGWAFDIWEHVLANRMPLMMVVINGIFMLWGLLFNGWNIIIILFLYWVELGVSGVFAVIKMAKTENKITYKQDPPSSRRSMISFFCIHFTMFWIGYAGALCSFLDSDPNNSICEMIFTKPWIALAIILMITNYTISLKKDYFMNGKYKTADLTDLFAEPYIGFLYFTAYVLFATALFEHRFFNIHYVNKNVGLFGCLVIIAKTIIDYLIVSYKMRASIKTKDEIEKKKEEMKKTHKNRNKNKLQDYK